MSLRKTGKKWKRLCAQDNYISCFSPESPMIKYGLAGLLARCLLNAFPFAPGEQWPLFSSISKAGFKTFTFRVLHFEFATYSYGDSAGLTPASLFIPLRGNQTGCKCRRVNGNEKYFLDNKKQ
jgi:hypothetical protein